MPFDYLQALAGRKRTETANRQLARYLAFIAGAVNAGGFLAIRQYTAHMSGVVAAMAENLALWSVPLVLDGFAAVLAFCLGAFATTLLIRWARSRALESEYALPLLAESALLLTFGFTGNAFAGRPVLGITMLLCFTMGMQNAMITKLSNAVIRTTHITGILTDIGIILGRIVFTSVTASEGPSPSELPMLRLLLSLVLMFFVGGVVGALGFRHVGFYFTLPLALILLLLATAPVLEDMRRVSNQTT